MLPRGSVPDPRPTKSAARKGPHSHVDSLRSSARLWRGPFSAALRRSERRIPVVAEPHALGVEEDARVRRKLIIDLVCYRGVLASVGKEEVPLVRRCHDRDSTDTHAAESSSRAATRSHHDEPRKRQVSGGGDVGGAVPRPPRRISARATGSRSLPWRHASLQGATRRRLVPDPAASQNAEYPKHTVPKTLKTYASAEKEKATLPRRLPHVPP